MPVIWESMSQDYSSRKETSEGKRQRKQDVDVDKNNANLFEFSFSPAIKALRVIRIGKASVTFFLLVFGVEDREDGDVLDQFPRNVSVLSQLNYFHPG